MTSGGDSARGRRLLALGVQAVVATLVLAGVPSQAEAARPGPAVKVLPHPAEASIPGRSGIAPPRPEGGGAGSTRVYVANTDDNTVSVIDATSNSVAATITLPPEDIGPSFLAVDDNPRAPRAYIPEQVSNTVTVLDLRTHEVISEIPVGYSPNTVALDDDVHQPRAYTSNFWSGDISVIDLKRGTVVATVPIGGNPLDVAVLKK